MSHSSASSSGSSPSLHSDGSGLGSSYNGLSTSTTPLDRNPARLTEFGFRNTLAPKSKGFFERIRGRADSKEDATKPGASAIQEEEEDGEATAESVATGRRQPRPRTPPSPAGHRRRQSDAHSSAEGGPIWSPPHAGSAPEPAPAPAPRAAPAAPPTTLNRQYWMSDENCKVCYDCGLAFHFWRRRHHCRLCGQIFCGSCSDQTVDGNRYQLKDGQVRVCKQCFALDKGNSALLSMAANTIGQAPAGSAAAAATPGGSAVAPIPRTPAPARVDGPPGGTSGTPHLTRANSIQASQSLSSSSSPIVRPPAVSAVDGLTGIDGQAAASSTGGYMDKLGRPPSGGGGSTAADGTALPDDLDLPGTIKLKRRSHKAGSATFGAAALAAASAKKAAAANEAADKDASGATNSASPPLDGGSAPGVASSPTASASGNPDDDSSSDDDVAVGENEENEEDSDDADATYDEEDDYVSASNNPAQHPTIDPTSPTSPLPEAISFSGATPRAQTPQAHSGGASQRPEGPVSVSSPTTLHSLQLTEQQNEIQLMALHRHRIHKVNKQHLLFVVACLARGYDVEEKWVATVLSFAERCTANLCVEPNKRTRHSMAIAAASGGALTTNPGGGNSLAMAGMLDDHMDITPYVKIKSLPGGSQHECRLIEGVMFRKNIAHKKMRSFVKNPRVLLLGCALEYQRIENRLSSLDTVLEQEKEYIQLQINKILAWKPDVIVVEKSVSRLAQDLIRAAGVTLVLNVKPSLMARLARATRATPIVPASDYIDKCASIGQCGRFIVETFTTQDDTPPASSLSPQEIARQRAMSASAAAAAARVIVMSFEECATRYHATILLRGAPTATLKRLKYILRMAIHTAYHLSLEAALLFDECATYSDANLEKLQNNYHAKISAMWGAQSEIAGQFLSRQAKLKVKNDAQTTAGADSSNSNGVSDPPSPNGPAPPLPSTPAPMRAGYSIPLSSSPFVDLVLVPIPQNIVDARRVLNIGQPADPSSAAAAGAGALAAPSNNMPPLWIHDCILFGSTWFSAAFQCFSPEVKGIEFYTATDKTLGCFLLENCFDLKLRCLNDKCGKDVLKHILAYTHHEGRIVITVKKIRKKQHHNSLLFSPAMTGGKGAGGSRTLASLAEHSEDVGSSRSERSTDADAASAPWSSATPSSASASSHPHAIRHPLDHPSDIMMWSRCRVCGRRVTPYMAMSDPTYKVSFGKYLDLTFHQKAAVCRTGSCSHSLHENHVRFFGYGGLMASFEYEPFPSYTMVTIPKSVPVGSPRDSCLVLKYEAELRALALISYVVFEEFIVRIAEIDGLLDKQEQRDQLRRLTKKVCKERDRFTTYLQQIGLGPPKSKAQMARTATGLETAVLALAVDPANVDGTAPANSTTAAPSCEPTPATAPPACIASPAPSTFGSYVPSSSSAAAAVVLFDCMDVYRLQRRLILNFLSWNNKLSDLSVLFFPKQTALSHSHSAREAISAWWNRPREIAAAAAAEPAPKPSGSKESSTNASASNNRDPAQTPPESRRESAANGVVAPSTAVSIDASLSPEPAPVGGPLSPQFLSPTSSDGGGVLSDSSPFKVLPTSGSFNNTPNTAAEPIAAAEPQQQQPQQQQQRTSAPPPASPAPAPAPAAAPAPAPAAASAPKEPAKKSEFSFRDLFNRMTTDSNSKVPSVHSFNVTVEMLTAHNPQLPVDSFDCLKQPPHLGLPPVLPPLSIPVQDDQPSSIIAYTLASLEHLLSVGRIRSNEVKVLQHQQSWMAYEEEQAVCELDLAPPKPPRSERSDRDELQQPQPARVSSTSISSSSRSSLPFPAPLQSSGSFGSHVSSSPEVEESSSQGRARDESTSSNAPAASASPSHVTGATPTPLPSPLHHSYSEHHISFLYPHSQHTSLPHRAPPPLPQHLTAPSLLGFDPIRDRQDLVESTMTKFWNGGDSAAMPPPTSASSGPHSTSSTDHAQHTFKYQFEDTGMAGSLHGVLHHEATMSPDPHAADVERTIFRCTVYFPRQFHALRLMTLGGDYDFIQSLCHCTRWGVTGGKSGSTFLKTSDERFILKCITRTELKMFLEGAHKYFAYMAKNVFHALPSFLVKILGVYQLSWKKHNFKRKDKDHSSGSSSSDKGKNGGSGGAEADSDSMHNASSLSSQYILVMPNLFFGAASEGISKIFDLKGSARNRYIKRKNREENRVLLDENLMEYTDGYPLPLNDSSKQLLRMSVFNDTLFLSNLEIVDYSIIVGLQTGNQKLVVGIIDYIRQYTWDKRLEMGVKSVGMIAGQNIPTIISPQNYKMRFRLAMERYFMVSPDHSSRLTLLSTNSAANDANEKEGK